MNPRSTPYTRYNPVREWLTLGRPHTASLTIPTVLLGGVLSGAEPHVLLLLGIWAFLFHYVGFAWNAIEDADHDREDPSKAHFPLVSGAIAEKTAAWYALLLTALLLFLPVFTSFWVWVFAFIAFYLGFFYNSISKERPVLGVLSISAAFACLPIVGYLAGPAWDPTVAWYLALYGFSLMAFQIGVSGFLKDIGTDAPNLLRRWGYRQVGDGFETGRPWPYLLRLPVLVLPALVIADHPVLYLPVLLLQVVIFFVTLEELGEGPFRRERRVRLMAVNEVLVYWLLVVSFGTSIGVLHLLAFLVLPMAWFMMWNRYLWGTWLAPRV